MIKYEIINKTLNQIHGEFGRGIDKEDVYDKRYKTYGKNTIDIPIKSNRKIITDEILSPFYIFQVNISKFEIIIMIGI